MPAHRVKVKVEGTEVNKPTLISCLLIKKGLESTTNGLTIPQGDKDVTNHYRDGRLSLHELSYIPKAV